MDKGYELHLDNTAAIQQDEGLKHSDDKRGQCRNSIDQPLTS